MEFSDLIFKLIHGAIIASCRESFLYRLPKLTGILNEQIILPYVWLHRLNQPCHHLRVLLFPFDQGLLISYGLFLCSIEDAKKLEQVYCDPVQRLVAHCVLMDVDTAVVSDRKGSIAVLSSSDHLEDSASPECNLTLSCSYYMGDIAMSIRKGSFAYKLPADDVLRSCAVANTISDLSHNSIMASTLLGSVIIFIPVTRREYELLEAVQARLVIHPLTAPILDNDHNDFRSRESSVGARKMLDGDMLAQFLELTSMQQEAVLALPLSSPNGVMLSSKQSPPRITVNQIVRLLERVHYALN